MRVTRSKYLLLLSCIIALSCSPSKEGEVKIVRNPEKGLWEDDPSKQFYLIEDLVIGKEKGDENYVFAQIFDVATDSKDNIYILDAGNYRVQKFDSTGKYLRTIGRKGKGPGEFLRPTAIAIDKSNNLYVADMGNARISKFDSAGNFVSSFRLENVSNMPQSMKIDSHGNIYLVYFDIENRKLIHKYSPEGEYLLSFCNSYAEGKNIDVRVESVYAKGAIDIDPNDIIYFTQLAPYEIRKFSTDGKLLCRIFRENSFMPPPPEPEVKGEALTFHLPKANSFAIVVLGDKFINLVGITGSDEIIVDLFNVSGELLISKHLQKSVLCKDNKGRIYTYSDKPYITVSRYRISFSNKEGS